MPKKIPVETISVIVPKNPFVPSALSTVKHCLAALDVEKLMEWWPGTPHAPHRDANKVRAIQRSLDWKRVAQIAAYLLQREIIEAPEVINKYFREIYEPRKLERGREWPPKIPKVVGFQRSGYPTFSNVLLHVNGAEIKLHGETAKLIIDPNSKKLNFSVIDGQHRINGAYLAVCIRKGEKSSATWEIPAEVFLDLDVQDEPPRHQAQIFIDVNFYQKKVDKSLVADLFPTARGAVDSISNKERAQDLGRKLMLEVGPMVGMIQIPGIKYGVPDVVTLATLNSAIEDVLDVMTTEELISLDDQAAFLAQILDAWLVATGRKEELRQTEKLDPNNVAYQGRVVVSFLTLTPACIHHIRKQGLPLVGEQTANVLTKWLKQTMKRASFLLSEKFIPKSQFKAKGYLGSGGIAKFRDMLWAAALASNNVSGLDDDEISALASKHRAKVIAELSR